MAKTPRPSRPKVFVTRRLPEAIEQRLQELFDTSLRTDDTPLDQTALARAMRTADVLVPMISDRIDAEVIAGADVRVRLIANFGNGIDHIDLKAARAGGIVVTNTPGVLTEDTADMTIALILSVTRRLAEGEKLVRAGAWTGWSPTFMLGRRLSGKTLGIVGMGRIGQAVACRARAFGLSVRYHNRNRLPGIVEEQTGATWCSELDALLGEAEIVSVHCPHTTHTHRLIDARRIGLLRPSATLINTARGEIVDEAALIDALEGGRIAGAGLDVFGSEPAIDPRLLALPNVVLLPHLGSATIEGRADTGAKVIANIRAWTDGHRPPDQVLEGWA